MKSAFDCSVSTPPENLISDVEDNQHVENQDLLDRTDARAPSKADQLIEEIRKQDLSDPVKILRFFQKEFVKGRDLDVTRKSELKEGEANYISIDRHDI